MNTEGGSRGDPPFRLFTSDFYLLWYHLLNKGGATLSENEKPAEPTSGDRRKGDRRKAQLPFDGPDRRKSDRRSGKDRRETPRTNDN